jgi:hypothetical protein
MWNSIHRYGLSVEVHKWQLIYGNVKIRMLRHRVVFATHSLQVVTSLLLYMKLDAVLKIFMSELDRRL